MSDRVLPATGETGHTAARLNALLVQAALPPLTRELSDRFETYLGLILRWNARTNLTSIRDEAGILSRHFVESIACAHAIPPGTNTLLDFGSGAGFPGIPISLCRPEISVTLAESRIKKAAFLRESIRVLGLRAAVHAARAESLAAAFDCVTMRAVDQMHKAVSVAARLVSPGGSLVLLTTGAESSPLKSKVGFGFTWNPVIRLPFGTDRQIEVGLRADGADQSFPAGLP
jgi:16S rRNA (guanine527-N7)-methyltransferase